MTQTWIIGLLVCYIIVRESFFLYSTHKFVNKIMSHNFYEYRQAENIGKPDGKKPVCDIEDDFPEDLGGLTGMGVF